MKKPLWVVFLVVFSLLLTGCQYGAPPQENLSQDSSLPSSEIAATGHEEVSPPSRDAGAQKEPLQLGERIVTEGSFNDMEERFGPCENYKVAFEGFGTMMYEIQMNYPKMWILLRLSIPSLSPLEDSMDSRLQEENGLGNYTLTEEDKNEKSRVQEIHWADPAIKGPRDTMIGDSVGDVKARFLDLSEQYNDRKTLYKLSDVDPSYPDEPPERHIIYSGAHMSPISGAGEQEGITYYANVPPDQEDSDYWYAYEYTIFYFMDGKVSSITQGYFSDLDRP